MDEDRAVPDTVERLLSTSGLQPPWGLNDPFTGVTYHTVKHRNLHYDS